MKELEIRMTLRLLAGLAAWVKQTARKQHRSVNNQIVAILEQEMNKMDTMTGIIRSSKTYRITFKTNTDFYIPSVSEIVPSGVVVVDSWTDLNASTEEQTVSEYLINAEATEWWEHLLDASPAVVRWEAVAGNWPAPVR